MTASGSAPPTRERQGRKRPLVGLLAILLVAGVLGAALDLVRERGRAAVAFPVLDGVLDVHGLNHPVEILRDPHGVPHVEAKSEFDAYFGLGFAHAQDRLAQMIWLSRSAQGRSSELVGEAGLPADRLARTLDFRGLAERDFAGLAGGERRILQAYAAGVNARMARVRDGEVASPLVLRSLTEGDRPSIEWEPWRPEDSLVVLKQYAWGLSSALDVGLVLADLVTQLGRYRAGPFFPNGGGEDTMPDAARALATGTGVWSGAGRSGLDWLVPDPVRRSAGLEGRGVGSSAWAIAGRYTRSGHPILVADAHLEPTAPSGYYVAHIRGGGVDVAGATLPGIPIFWSGRNPEVTWASTHARASTTELYEETQDASDPNRYNDGRGWKQFERRTERIAVLDGEDEWLTVRSTRHGPVLGTSSGGPGEPLSVAWTGAWADSTKTLEAFRAVASARDSDALVRALGGHHEPPLAVVYADQGGKIGMQVAGWIPRREFDAGLIPLPGRAKWYDWAGPMDYEDLPRVDGDPDWVIAADNRFPEHGESPRIEWLWRGGARAARIGELLAARAARERVDLRSMVQLQGDHRATRARVLAQRAVAWSDASPAIGPEAAEIANLLRSWDGETGPGSAGSAAYHVFLDRLSSKLLTRVLGKELASRYQLLSQADPLELIGQVLMGVEPAGAVSRGTPSSALEGLEWADSGVLRAEVSDSLRQTWLHLSFELGSNRDRWGWGRLHALQFRPFGFSQSLGGAAHLGPFPRGGNGDTVDTSEYAPATTFDVRVASTFRFATDAGQLDEALFSLAPGQSEHPGHPHFSGGLERWLDGRPTLLTTSELLVEESSIHHLTLNPET